MNRTSPTLVATLLLLGSVAAAAAETVTFRFVPPAGATFAARELQNTEIRIGANKSLSAIAALSRIRITREAGATYIAHRYDEMAASKDGGPFETPPQIAAMLGSEIVHVLRGDGTLARVDGYQKLAEKALPKMTGEAKASLEKYVAEGRQDDRDRASWYELEMLIDQTLQLDRDYWYEAAWSDESGWMLHHTLMRLGPWVQHPVAGRLLTVKLAYVPNALAKVSDAEHLAAKVASRLDPRKPGKVAPGLKVEGTASFLIDPASLVVWKLDSFRKVSEPVQVSSDLGVTLVTEEKVSKTLEPAAKPVAR